jgi:hypothetical protein
MIIFTGLGGDDGHGHGHGDPGDCGDGRRRTSIGGTLSTAKHSNTVRRSFCTEPSPYTAQLYGLNSETSRGRTMKLSKEVQESLQASTRLCGCWGGGGMHSSSARPHMPVNRTVDPDPVWSS